MDLELQENVAYYLAGQKEVNDAIINLGMPIGTCLMLTCEGCNKAGDMGCSAYKDPMVLSWHRHGVCCPHNAPVVKRKKQKINPLKANKRS